MSEVTTSYSSLVSNCAAEYVDASTKELLHIDYFHDPEISWQFTKKGQLFLHSRHGGNPTPEWLRNNPRPK